MSQAKGLPEVVPVNTDAGVLAGSDEGIQVVGVHHGQHIAVMQRHLFCHPARDLSQLTTHALQRFLIEALAAQPVTPFTGCYPEPMNQTDHTFDVCDSLEPGNQSCMNRHRCLPPSKQWLPSDMPAELKRRQYECLHATSSLWTDHTITLRLPDVCIAVNNAAQQHVCQRHMFCSELSYSTA